MDERPAESNADNSESKRSQAKTTLQWLSENYMRAEGVCLPRSVLYTHYLDFCKRHNFTPTGPATFGKLLRQKFPRLTTRRLGTRGYSKYHYYGIGIKRDSIYFHAVYNGKQLTRFSGRNVKTEGTNRKYNLSSKTGTFLPSFPEANSLIFPKQLGHSKVQTLLLMYQTHCQRILDTVIAASFDDVQNLLLHFWHGMPDHLVTLLDADVISDVIVYCDVQLYDVLTDVLVPSTIQNLSESLVLHIKLFATQLPLWLQISLEEVPPELKRKKMEVARTFVKNLRRYYTFINLAQKARTVLSDPQCVGEILNDLDLKQVHLNNIYQEICFVDTSTTTNHLTLIQTYFEDLKSLLRKQAPMQSYVEWMDNILDKALIQSSLDDKRKQETKNANFLQLWTMVGSLIMRELTLNNASNFGSVHLILLMMNEYMFLAVETQLDNFKQEQLKARLRNHLRDGQSGEQYKTRQRSSKHEMSHKYKKNGNREQFSQDMEIDNIADCNDFLKPVDHQVECNYVQVNSFSELPQELCRNTERMCAELHQQELDLHSAVQYHDTGHVYPTNIREKTYMDAITSGGLLAVDKDSTAFNRAVSRSPYLSAPRQCYDIRDCCRLNNPYVKYSDICNRSQPLYLYESTQNHFQSLPLDQTQETCHTQRVDKGASDCLCSGCWSGGSYQENHLTQCCTMIHNIHSQQDDVNVGTVGYRLNAISKSLILDGTE